MMETSTVTETDVFEYNLWMIKSSNVCNPPPAIGYLLLTRLRGDSMLELGAVSACNDGRVIVDTLPAVAAATT